MLLDFFKALQGDPAAIYRIINTLANSPFYIREKWFWIKMEEFLNGVFIDEEDNLKLRVKLSECGVKDENIFRLIEYIDRAESKKKIHYMVNATRCALTNFIDLSDLFRISYVVTYTLEEDLEFLRNNIEKKDIAYGFNVQGCLSTGLMLQSKIDEQGNQYFSFTPLAQMVDQYAVSYDDDSRYPNPTVQINGETEIKTNLPITKYGEYTYNEIDTLFEKYT